jgi:hypothetical protein
VKVHLALGRTDMRKGLDGFATLGGHWPHRCLAMARSAISAANEASLSALPAESLVAVREHSRWIAARMMASGSGTRSAVPMTVETNLM